MIGWAVILDPHIWSFYKSKYFCYKIHKITIHIFFLLLILKKYDLFHFLKISQDIALFSLKNKIKSIFWKFLYIKSKKECKWLNFYNLIWDFSVEHFSFYHCITKWQPTKQDFEEEKKYFFCFIKKKKKKKHLRNKNIR